jgi:hypothetical protein
VKPFWLLFAFCTLSVVPALAEVGSVVLTDVPHNGIVTLDFQCEFENISSVEISMTSNIGPVFICGENWMGPWSNPCGNLTQFNLGDEAYLRVNGLGEINNQTWSEWIAGPSLTGDPMTDWSFLNSGVTTFNLRCFTDGCSPNWIYGEFYCGPYDYQVDEIEITVNAGTVATEPMAWGQIKSLYR